MRYAFVLALGRSGTQFLARMLQHDPNAAVYHEPYAEDRINMALRHAGMGTVVDGKMATRFEEMARRSAGHSLHLETNSYLRYEAPWLAQNLDAKLIHLVRDPRTFVPSAYARDVYTPADIQAPIVPHNSDAYARKWQHMDRFAKICWYWNHSNTQLADTTPNSIHMESILDDYEALSEHILQPFGLQLDKAVWQNEVSRPANTRTRYRCRRILRGLSGRASRAHHMKLPAFPQWSTEQKKIFDEICGGTMERLGYHD